jgi:hypothetical protein
VKVVLGLCCMLLGAGKAGGQATHLMPRSGERCLWAVIELARRFMTVQKLVYGSSATLPARNEALLMDH